jgi:hypothetical protein
MTRFLRFVYAIALAVVGLGLLGVGMVLLIGGDGWLHGLGAVMVACSWGVSRIAYPLSVRLFGPNRPKDPASPPRPDAA